ncbi:RNA helicase [Caenorhabditis elegans]|uniref:Dicer-related helicase n=2 Tax=Caenorhabditis elegans TaxID=6239 RepID=G5EDI8_CAEEL|nr:RNA helicase [Caenorhabditis elegans]AAM76083.1 dicer-related helicase [Caenorhabditis elegans]CCD62350.1 RNA helicase [Caenorhabditis elegans]|eukprot:NP_501018.1 Dicer Related Helicase [Caenorhabditis elegans]
MRKKQCSSILSLYDKEIILCLEPIYRDPEKGDGFSELLPLGRIDELKIQSENAQEFSKQLYHDLKNSILSNADDERLYKDIMTYLQTYLPKCTVHKLLNCSNREVKLSDFHYILDHFEGFLRFIEPKVVLAYLDSYPQYIDAVAVLRKEIERNEEDNQDSDFIKKLILRTVPLLGEQAVYDIMYTISEKSSNNLDVEAKQFIAKVLRLKNDGFLRFYQIINASRRQLNGRIYICPVHESATEMMVYLGTAALNTNRYRMINIRVDNIVQENSTPRLVIESVRQRIHRQRQLCLRNYQEELCQVALQGKNTIVTAPTGSGKTVIAANIIKEHFESRSSEGKRFKALFMTPNSMILNQQAASISSYLDHVYHTQIIQGSDNVPTRNVIQSKDLIVATPQMIVNLCNEHRNSLDDESRLDQFFLSTFTIIFFDECHNTVKNSPYSNIMREYHYLKNMGNMPEGHSLPQIIGLTASLGTGDKNDCLQVRNYIAGLCASMDVKDLSIVKDNLEELRGYSPIVPDKVLLCERSTDGPIGMFTNRLTLMMQEVEGLIRTALRNEHIGIEQRRQIETTERDFRPDSSFLDPPADKEHAGYQNWVCNQMNLVSGTSFRETGTRTIINEALDVLKECFCTLSYNINFHPEVALNYLKDEMEYRTPNFTVNMIRIWERYHNQLVGTGSAENPMISKTVQYIVEQNLQRADSRTIIFVRTRYEATILNKVLNSNEELLMLGIKSEWMSGLNKSTASSADISASKQKQMEKLKMFADGEIRILVSTSVAEEGLDVPECSLVIKYNYATNEIAHVQRRGRGRALNSECVLITNSIALRDQESNNRDKESLMSETISLIQNSPAEFRKCVDEESNKIWPRILREDTDKAQKIEEQINRNIVYKIICKKCEAILCTSKDIRSRNTQYLVCDPGFWSLVRKTRLTDEQQALIKYNATGSINCRRENCGLKLGQLIEVNTVDLPCLSALSIVLLVEGTDKRIIVKKWKNILDKYFTPTEIRQLDVQTMRDADQARTPMVFEHHANGEVVNLIREA